ncbi:DUF397 domain-containing protein [Streptomyces thioluteus]|uniref:DUF397 domain-containing protein n=1 Tax=Streptomyces thioluteus TaxID=66431 RepID=UPI003CD0591A
MPHVHNGMVASGIDDVVWRKSRYSNSQGSCVEFAKLPGGGVAVRNSRHTTDDCRCEQPASLIDTYPRTDGYDTRPIC